MGNPVFKFSLIHVLPVQALQFSNNEFEVSLTGWSQINSGSDINFSWNNPSSALASGAAPDTSAIGQARAGGWPAGTYTIAVTATNSSTGGSSPLSSGLHIWGSDDGTSLDTAITLIGTSSWAVGAGPITRTITFTLTESQDYLFFKFVKEGPGTGYNANINLDSIELIEISDATADPVVISEPDGWKDMKLTMERHPEFHSLVEFFESPLVFYGENNFDNGGADYIRQIEQLYGFNTELRILVEADIDGDGVYEETIFDGQLDISGLQELKYNKIEVPIIRSDMWAKFIARKETPVDLRSTTDLDGDTVSVTDLVDINLSGQTIEKVFYGEFNYPVNFNVNGAGGYIQFTPDEFVLDEIEEVFPLYTAFNPAIPVFFFSPTERGSYTFDIRVVISGDITAPSGDPQQAFSYLGDIVWKLFFQVNDGPLVKFDYVNFEFPVPNYLGNGWTEYTFQGTYFLEIGDEVKVYGDEQGNVYTILTFWTKQGAEFRVDGGGGANELYVNFDHGYEVPSYFRITGQTEYAGSTAQAYLIHDAAASIINRIIGRNCFYSEFFGGTSTTARQYASNGCGWKNIVTKGLQIRGYTFDEKIMSMSFMDWWEGANPIFNLGLGYDVIDGEEVIRVEEKEYFFNPNSTATYISNVKEIFREYDHDCLYNRIEVGYDKWQSENISGLDEIQSKRVWATLPGKINKALKIHSKFIAASLAIEVTRRQKIEQSKDYKYDNDNFIIAISGDDLSPDRFVPELDENFDSITGVKNSGTRYNTIHSALRMLLRWGNWWNRGLQAYQSSVLKFVSGEGNYDAQTEYNCSTGDECLGVVCGNISERIDLPLSTYGGVMGFIHFPFLFTIDIINYTWDQHKSIRNNREDNIGVHVIDRNHLRFFIKKLTYEVCKGKCSIVMWPYDAAAAGLMTFYNTTYLDEFASDMPEREYSGSRIIPEDCGERVRLLEDGDERVTEDGECRNLEDGPINYFYQQSEAIPFYMYQESETTETYFYQESEV
jgi:hypothetical protein